MTARAAEYILWQQKTMLVKAKVRSNGVDCYAVQDEHGIALVPVAVAQKAPGRSRPRLCCVDGRNV